MQYPYTFLIVHHKGHLFSRKVKMQFGGLRAQEEHGGSKLGTRGQTSRWLTQC